MAIIHFIKKHHSRIKIFSTLILWALMMLFVNVRLDLSPNSLIIEIPNDRNFLTPQIILNTGTDQVITRVDPGEATPALLERINAFEVSIDRQPILVGEDLLLTNSSLQEAAQTTTWFAYLPTGIVKLEQINRFILVPQGDVAAGGDEFEFLVNDVEWEIVAEESYFIAEKPETFLDIPASVQVIRTEHWMDEGGEVTSSPGIQSIIALSENPPLLELQSITLGHSFGKLGFQFPLHTWDAEDILKTFDLGENANNYSIDEGMLTLRTEDRPSYQISYPADPSEPALDVTSKISLYYLLFNLAATGIAVGYFFAFGYLPKLNFKRKINFIATPAAAMVLLIIGVTAELLNLTTANTTLLIASLVGMLVAVILDLWVLRKQPERLHTVNAEKLTRWEMYLLIGLLICGAAVLFFRLGSFDLWEDEFQVVEAAAGFLKTGRFERWDWINETTIKEYGRAWPHTLLIAQAFRFFGISEWSARLVSALSGIGFFTLLFFITRQFTNKSIALLTLVSAIFYHSYVVLFRYTRMYALLLPLFLLLTYLLYRGLTGERRHQGKENTFNQRIGPYINFDYRFLLPAIPLLYLTYLVHVNTLIIVPAVFIYICLLAVIEKKQKFIFLAVLGAIIGPLAVGILFVLDRTGSLTNNYLNSPAFLTFLSAFESRNFVYFDFLVDHPFGVIAGTTLILLMVYAVFINRKDPVYLRKYLYLFTMVITGAVFFIFVAARYASYMYISHLTPFALVLVISGLWHLGHWTSKCSRFVVLLLVFVLLFNFAGSLPRLYFGQFNRGKFSTAYQVIIDNYDYDNQVIFGQYLRTFYLRDLDQINSISMEFTRRYPYEQFLADLAMWDEGWVTWESVKSYHINQDIRDFIDQNFQKVHGRGVDETGVEVYYFTRTDYSTGDAE